MVLVAVLGDGLGGALAGSPLAVAAPGGSQLAAVGGLDVLQGAAVVRQCGSDGTLPGGLGNLDGLPVCDERRVRALLGCAHDDHFSRGVGRRHRDGFGLALQALSSMTLPSSAPLPALSPAD